jgi:hypothetical protein
MTNATLGSTMIAEQHYSEIADREATEKPRRTAPPPEAPAKATAEEAMVGTGGIEPPTPSASGKCSPAELRAFSSLAFKEFNKQSKALTEIVPLGNRVSAVGTTAPGF